MCLHRVPPSRFLASLPPIAKSFLKQFTVEINRENDVSTVLQSISSECENKNNINLCTAEARSKRRFLLLIFTVSCLKEKFFVFSWLLFGSGFLFQSYAAKQPNHWGILQVNDFTMLSKTSLFIQNFVKYLCEACAYMEFNFLLLETVVESFLQ